MFRGAGKYIVGKLSSSMAGKAVKYSFWGLICFFGPVAVVSTVGVPGLALAAVTVHSGLIEYGTQKAVNKII